VGLGVSPVARSWSVVSREKSKTLPTEIRISPSGCRMGQILRDIAGGPQLFIEAIVEAHQADVLGENVARSQHAEVEDLLGVPRVELPPGLIRDFGKLQLDLRTQEGIDRLDGDPRHEERGHQGGGQDQKTDASGQAAKGVHSLGGAEVQLRKPLLSDRHWTPLVGEIPIRILRFVPLGRNSADRLTSCFSAFSAHGLIDRVSPGRVGCSRRSSHGASALSERGLVHSGLERCSRRGVASHLPPAWSPSPGCGTRTHEKIDRVPEARKADVCDSERR